MNQIIPINYRRENKIIQDIDYIIEERDKYRDKFKINKQYVCFNNDPSILTNTQLYGKEGSKNKPLEEHTLLNAEDKDSCEAKYDYMGNPKKSGVWDRPCIEDKDCPFYNSNKNYKNTYGKCNKKTGQCELPINMMNIGYHYFFPTKKYEPYCYNCESKQWLPITKLGKCCKEQNDKEKYPFLKSPDYAFADDNLDRMNSYLQRNCKLKSGSKNMIDSKIECKKNTFDLY